MLYRLKYKGAFMDPKWYMGMEGKKVRKEVGNENFVIVKGVQLFFPDGEKPKNDTIIIIRLDSSWNVVYETEVKLKEKKISEEEELKNRQIKIKQDMNKLRVEANEFNATIKMPVKWGADIKHVLSGLTKDSCGTGHKKNSVWHILLLENLDIGKFHRVKGEFLCSNSYKHYVDQKPIKHYDGDNKTYTPKITCKKCLDVAKNLKKFFKI